MHGAEDERITGEFVDSRLGGRTRLAGILLQGAIAALECGNALDEHAFAIARRRLRTLRDIIQSLATLDTIQAREGRAVLRSQESQLVARLHSIQP